MSIIDDILSSAKDILLFGPSLTPGQQKAGPTVPDLTLPTYQSGGRTRPLAPDSAVQAADSVGSVLDFLKLIAWLFQKQNWLRAVEVFFGFILMMTGMFMSLRSWQGRRQIRPTPMLYRALRRRRYVSGNRTRNRTSSESSENSEE